jgi:hypothetical protein
MHPSVKYPKPAFRTVTEKIVCEMIFVRSVFSRYLFFVSQSTIQTYLLQRATTVSPRIGTQDNIMTVRMLTVRNSLAFVSLALLLSSSVAWLPRPSLALLPTASSSPVLTGPAFPATVVVESLPHSTTDENSSLVIEESVEAPSPVPLEQRTSLVLQYGPTAVSVWTGTLATFVLNNVGNIGPIPASSAVSLAAALGLPEKFALAVMCGSFAGMVRFAVVPSILAGGLLGVCCAGMLRLFDSKGWLVGCGGRLGFVAQVACTMQFVARGSWGLLAASPATPSVAALVNPSLYAPGRLLSSFTQLPSIILSTIAGGIFMRSWKQVLGQSSKPVVKRIGSSVGAVGATGLLGSALIPAAAGPIFCGSFIGMSAPGKLPTLTSLVGACAMAGACQVAMTGVLLGGWGGKLGTAALLGVVLYRGLTHLIGEPSTELTPKPMVTHEPVPVISPVQ